MQNGYLGSRSPEKDMGSTTMNHKLGKGQEGQTAWPTVKSRKEANSSHFTTSDVMQYWHLRHTE